MTFLGGLMWISLAAGLGAILWKRPDIPMGGGRQPVSHMQNPWKWRLIVCVLIVLASMLLILDILRRQ